MSEGRRIDLAWVKEDSVTYRSRGGRLLGCHVRLSHTASVETAH